MSEPIVRCECGHARSMHGTARDPETCRRCACTRFEPPSPVSPQTGYSRAEFERDQMGETGDRLSAEALNARAVSPQARMLDVVSASAEEIAQFVARPCGRCGCRADLHVHLYGSAHYLCPAVGFFEEVATSRANTSKDFEESASFVATTDLASVTKSREILTSAPVSPQAGAAFQFEIVDDEHGRDCGMCASSVSRFVVVFDGDPARRLTAERYCEYCWARLAATFAATPRVPQGAAPVFPRYFRSRIGFSDGTRYIRCDEATAGIIVTHDWREIRSEHYNVARCLSESAWSEYTAAEVGAALQKGQPT